MGFLHEGHLSLIRESKKKCDVTFVSIFVNPTQFAPSEDLSEYPRDLQKDKILLKQEAVDYLFLPGETEIYSRNFQTYVNVEHLTCKFEGEKRPTRGNYCSNYSLQLCYARFCFLRAKRCAAGSGDKSNGKRP